MKKIVWLAMLLVAPMLVATAQKFATEPLVDHLYTADPSAHVFNGKIYIYPSHDIESNTAEDDEGGHFDMKDYHVLSMGYVGGKVTDHGVALDIKNIPWVSRQLWAPDAAYANNTYYLYFPAKDKEGIFRIGVATSKNPEGPFVAEKKPMGRSYSIDPCVFKDDDGTFYMYFGGIWGGQLQRWDDHKYNPKGALRKPDEQAVLPRIAKLSKDMKSFQGEVGEIALVDENKKLFQEKQNDKRFFEAAWVHKYKGKYYFSYSTGDTHNICYAIGNSPYGPFVYKGVLLKPVAGWTNHHSIVETNGKWYLFYHDVQRSGKTHLRNIKVAELTYNADGTIQTVSSFVSDVASDKGLKDYYKDYFPVGVAVSPRALLGDEASLIKREFNSLTPENAMKMGPIHPKEKEYFWSDADSIVAFAQRNKMKLRGHTLCWHNQTPAWMFVDAKGDTVSKTILLQRLKDHITTVVSRYKGKIYAWDVVNEVISDKPGEVYRKSAWYKICGEEYIAKAFQYAHEADPEAQLFYNDYNEIDAAKREKIVTMVTGLKQAGVPIHGVGLQGHWALNEPSAEQLDKTLARFSETGLKIQITELDISVYPKEHNVRAKTAQDFNTEFTAEKEQKQAEIYRTCFELFRKYRSFISGVTFWNVSDRNSWLDNFPVRDRKDYPLLFDQNLKRKNAYGKVAEF
ncbi:endo-1,4-beta-xylanase [Chryseolinea lacunae]|uniref:Beta-xylanase n=1 Tax=Chryseolinea lacunae TaxID=2801331 RepID=A0ABS1KMW0_9BACT|nr:endo-1,4-beta-xylanase [Chryseolinea lacunae]